MMRAEGVLGDIVLVSPPAHEVSTVFFLLTDVTTLSRQQTHFSIIDIKSRDVCSDLGHQLELSF